MANGKWSWCWGSSMTRFGFNPVQEESRVSERHGALDPSACVLLLPIISVPAFATSTLIPLCHRNLLFQICPGGDPIWWRLHKHFYNWGGGKGHSTLLRKSLVLTLPVEGPVCNTKLIVMSISSSIVQWVVLHFSSLFAFHHLHQDKPFLSTKEFTDMLKTDNGCPSVWGVFDSKLWSEGKFSNHIYLGWMTMFGCQKGDCACSPGQKFWSFGLLFLTGLLSAKRTQIGLLLWI